jgi:hypothetical protein
MSAVPRDPRNPICKALHNLLSEIRETGSVSESSLLAFREQIPATNEAFGNDPAARQYLQDLDENATELYEIRVRLTHTRPGSERDDLIRRASTIQKWVLSDRRTRDNPTYNLLTKECRDR